MAQQGHQLKDNLDPRIYVDVKSLQALANPARSISLLPRQSVGSLLNGRNASKLRGRGLNFEELRAYLPGDDPRTIDWRVTARTRTPHVRVYSEERDRPGLVVVDQRMSMFFGTVAYMKSVVAAEAAAVLAHRLLGQGDRVGGLIFGDGVISEHKPKRSRATLSQFLTALARANHLLSAQLSQPSLISLAETLQRTSKLMHKSSLAVIISDFDGVDGSCEPLFRQLSQQGDLILIHVSDPASERLTEEIYPVSDGDLQASLDLTDPTVRDRVQHASDSRLDMLRDWSRKYNFSILPLSTRQAALPQMQRLFGLRPRLK